MKNITIFVIFSNLAEDIRYVILRIGRYVKSKKQAFCLADIIRITRQFGGPESPRYLQEVCREEPVSGVSVGWADIYTSQLPGQYIDITDIPSGTYWLRSTTNPDKILEVSGGSSSAQAKIDINMGREDYTYYEKHLFLYAIVYQTDRRLTCAISYILSIVEVASQYIL
jgi:hypothetical protein